MPVKVNPQKPRFSKVHGTFPPFQWDICTKKTPWLFTLTITSTTRLNALDSDKKRHISLSATLWPCSIAMLNYQRVIPISSSQILAIACALDEQEKAPSQHRTVLQRFGVKFSWCSWEVAAVQRKPLNLKVPLCGSHGFFEAERTQEGCFIGYHWVSI